MISIYLDWSVMSKMKQGKHAPLYNLLAENPEISIKYSTSHISDILVSYAENKEQLEIIEDDLNFIRYLTKDRCLFIREKQIFEEHSNPHELFSDRVSEKDLFKDISLDGLGKVFEQTESGKLLWPLLKLQLKTTVLDDVFIEAFENKETAELLEKVFPGLKENPSMEGFFKCFSNLFNSWNEGEQYKETREVMQKTLGINRDEIISSIDPYKIINSKTRGIDIKHNDFQKKSSIAPEWFDNISNEFILLDMYGYKEDKIKVTCKVKKTFRNTTDDAFHCAFASVCQIYILDDTNSYFKTKKVYEKLGISTLVFKPDEFIQFIAENSEQ
ncbi:hypothetical protein BH09BAC2_BH09BAC2_03610 [soil metagenome]